jgi:AraC family transcriptional regulator
MQKEERAGEEAVQDPARAGESGAFEDLKVFIAERLHEPLTVDVLARRYGCSPFHFARLFRKVVGQPPHEYIIEKRIAKAKEMLSWTDLPIGEITRRIGFGTQAHFSATFRERVGITPTAYRASHGRDPGTNQ